MSPYQNFSNYLQNILAVCVDTGFSQESWISFDCLFFLVSSNLDSRTAPLAFFLNDADIFEESRSFVLFTVWSRLIVSLRLGSY